MNLTVKEIVDKFKLLVLYCGEKTKLEQRKISNFGTNRGGLELTGFKSTTTAKQRRIMLLSSKETEYLDSLAYCDYENHFKNILDSNIPAIFVTVNFKHADTLCKIAKDNKSNVVIIYYSHRAADFINTISIYINERLAKMELVHGTLVNIFGYGVLIIGKSGIGKSEATLALIKSGHLFIGDDSINVFQINNKLIGKPVEYIKNVIEIRGIGILNVAKMYGYHIIMHETEIHLVVQLIDTDNSSWNKLDRLGNAAKYQKYFNIKIPLIKIPVTIGRNISDLIESAVINAKLKAIGQDATSEFENKVIKSLISNE